jgi:hypothetical protein
LPNPVATQSQFSPMNLVDLAQITLTGLLICTLKSFLARTNFRSNITGVLRCLKLVILIPFSC